MGKADDVYKLTARKIERLKRISDRGSGKGMLAELRRGVGKHPGEMPELWGLIFDDIPDECLGKERASGTEWAVYTALTLYALHCQGSDGDVYKRDISIGKAAAGLVDSEDDIQRVINRLNLVVTAVSQEDLAYHLRGLIQLFRSKSISLDHALLAKEMYLFWNQDIANDIKLRWGRDFYSVVNKKIKGEDNNG